ncbi:MAG: hypothetical protein JWR39_2734 [Devosia sp.]|jgi:hypothetical protein|nr:hypothetical protein [Devosia sp.]
MYVYVFTGRGSVMGYSPELSGINLPEHFGPWVMTRALTMVAGETGRPTVDTDACLGDIEQFGYHLTERGMRITASETVVPGTTPVRRMSA